MIFFGISFSAIVKVLYPQTRVYQESEDKVKELEFSHEWMIVLRVRNFSLDLPLILLVLLLIPLIPRAYAWSVENQRLIADVKAESAEAPVTDLKCDRAERNIELGIWGTIYVSDELHVSNPTQSPIDSVTLTLPSGSQNVTASDIAGPIEVFLPSVSAGLPPRAIIYFRFAIQENESYTFKVIFNVPASENIGLSDYNLFQLKFPMVPGFGASIKTLYVTVVLPEGANLKEKTASPAPSTIKKEMFQESAIFKIEGADFKNNRDLTFSYSYLIVWSAFRPTLWVGLFLSSLILARRILQIGRFEVQRVSVPTDLIRSFVDALDEKISLQAELASLKDRADSGGISKHRYRGRSRIVERQVASLSKELEGLKKEMKNSGEKYSDATRRIEVAEVDLETSEGNIERLERRYRSGEISRGVYDRLRYDYRERIKAAGTEIDRVIIELREEIR